MPTEILECLTQYGVAGLMGVLWLWERLYSRKREIELSESHARILADQQALKTLVDLVQQNTQAQVRFDHTQQQLCELLKEFRHEMVKRAA